VTLILTTKDVIFGGLTPIAWDSSQSHKTGLSEQSFLFRVKDCRNSDPRSFPLMISSYAIYCHSSYGPTFGAGHDLYVADGCTDKAKRSTALGHTYRNDTGLNGTEVFPGEPNFQVKEIEVFSITP
jgi:hypothetical protein